MNPQQCLNAFMLFACTPVSAQTFRPGDSPIHEVMPPVPESAAQYQTMWDPFVLRGPDDRPLALQCESASLLRVTGGFDRLPWNGRQIARDAAGNWFTLLVENDRRILLSGAAGSSTNAYRPRGGDFVSFELVGPGNGAVHPAKGAVSRAGMAFDGGGRLHVIWHQPDGLWHTSAAGGDGFDKMKTRDAWSAPRRLVEGACRAGDLMRLASGRIALSYSQDDTVYFLEPGPDAKPRAVSSPAAGQVTRPANDPSAPPRPRVVDDAEMAALERDKGKVPPAERECQDAVMDLAPDGAVWLAYRRDFAIWVTRRAPAGEWSEPEMAVREYVFHPSIIVTDSGSPLITFQHEGLRRIPLDLDGNLVQRAGGGSRIGYATRAQDGWRTAALAKAEEITVRRRGMWDKRGAGRMVSQIEQFGWPVLFRDGRGVSWALWMNTSRRWVYAARWMGTEFGEVMECRGPFNAPRLALHVEKHAPPGSADAGLIIHAAAAGGDDRAIFDRLRIPSLATTDKREVVFLDNLEVAATEGLDFTLHEMTKPIPVAALSPTPGRRVAWQPSVTKHGSLYVMRYQSPEDPKNPGPALQGYAISEDGLRFRHVDAPPADLPEPEPPASRALSFWKGESRYYAQPHYPNPDTSDPAKKFIRLAFTIEDRGSYFMEFSPDGKAWTRGPQVTAVEALRERAQPNLFDAADPERPLRVYSRVYTETGRSWGVAWTRDLARWSGVEHLVDPDEPYTKPAAISPIGNTGKSYTMRGQVFLDAVAGKNEDEIYAASVKRAEGLHVCFYWPGLPGRPIADIGLAVSRDGFNFTRVQNGKRVLPLGPPGSWDSGYIFQMNPMLDGDLVRVYYRGTAASREGFDGYGHHLSEIGVATIRAYGLTSFSSRAERGSLTTIPINAPPGSKRGLAVNFDPGPAEGRLLVEVLDAATGLPFPGRGAADCQPVTANGTATPVTWAGGDTLPAGNPLRLRFHLQGRGARLHSFGFRGVE